MCSYCRDNGFESTEDMIIDQILNFGLLGDLAVEVHIHDMNKKMLVDIGRVNCTYDGKGSVSMEKRIHFCPFCDRSLD